MQGSGASMYKRAGLKYSPQHAAVRAEGNLLGTTTSTYTNKNPMLGSFDCKGALKNSISHVRGIQMTCSFAPPHPWSAEVFMTAAAQQKKNVSTCTVPRALNGTANEDLGRGPCFPFFQVCV